MIDWDLAISTGVRWVRPGPQVSLAEARGVVSELHELAAAVAEPVRQVTGMAGAEDSGQVAVVDRPGWIRANIDGFRVVLDPLVEHLREQGRVPPPGSMVASFGSRVTGMQAGLILAYLAGRVLGQYELFLPADPGRAEHPHGRAGARRGPARLPPLGVPARGDAPDPVHLGELAARLRPAADDRLPARLGPRSGDDRDPDAVRGGRRRRGGARQRARRQPHRGHPDAAAAGGAGAADLRDDAGRGAR